jgi:hypothetical protein
MRYRAEQRDAEAKEAEPKDDGAPSEGPGQEA